MIEKHLSVADICRLLGISRTTAWRLVRSGAIQAPIRISPGRVAWPASAVEAYLSDCERSRAGGAT